MKKLEELCISPAPWKVIDSYQFPKGGEIVSVIAAANGKTVSVPNYNNGSFIAAEPEMYEALYDFVAYAETHAPLESGLNPVIDKARAALAKAAGESEVAK